MMKRLHLPLAALLVAVFCVPSSVRAEDFLGRRFQQWQTELGNKDPKVRRGAAFALGKFPGATSSAVPLLLKSLKTDDDPGVRDAAATALGDVMMPESSKPDRSIYWDDAKPVLDRALTQEKDARALRGALYAVGSFGSAAAPLLDQVKVKLKSGEPTIRQNAAWALGRMGEQASEAVDDLIGCLQDKEELVRRDAATALGDIGLPGAKAAARPLLALVAKEEDDVVRRTVLENLFKLVGPEHKDQAKTLYPLLGDEDPETKHLAAFVLAKIGGEAAKPALKVLCEALTDEEPHVQEIAAASLGNLGADAKPAVRDLGKTLRTSSNTETRRNCALALALIGPAAKDAVPDLVFVLKSDAPLEVRHFAAEALAKMQYPANADALPDLLKILAKNEPERQGNYDSTGVRQRCIWCFWYAEKENLPPNAVKVFTDILDETGENGLMVRYDAARVLALQLGEDAPEAAAKWLLHMLRNDQLQIYNRTDAKVNGPGSESSSGGSTVKATTGGDARFLAAQALGYMGKKASLNAEIVKELRKAAESKDDKLRKEAKDALKRLRLN